MVADGSSSSTCGSGYHDGVCRADPLVRAGPPGPAVRATKRAGQGAGCGPGGPPYMIGIDLGTTNSGIAYVERTPGELTDYPEIRIQEIPQSIAPGRIEPRRTLPSFLF